MTDREVCRRCGGSTSLAFTARDINRATGPGRYAYVRCNHCGVLALRDPPRRLERYYTSDYHVLPPVDRLDEVAGGESYKLDFLRAHVDPGPLVEVGPSVGAFAHLAKGAGFDVTAIEMDAACVSHLREAVGVNAIHSSDPAGTLRGLPPSRAIAMWQVIEHLSDPWEVLDAAAGNLERGGVLIVSTPNPTGLQARLLRGRWPHVDAPRHLFLIPPGTLVDQAVDLGLKPELVTGADGGEHRFNKFGWENPLTGVGNPLPIRALGALRTGPAVARLLAPIERRGLRGASYTAVLRKQSS